MFKLLENMKLYELTRVMRNSVEFHNLVKIDHGHFTETNCFHS